MNLLKMTKNAAAKAAALIFLFQRDKLLLILKVFFGKRVILMVRESGILMPMSSLPSPYGIGTMGKSAYRFVDFLKAAGQKYWQLLPLGPTSYGDSPYSSFSTFAGNPYYIDLDLLVKDGLLRRGEITGRDWGEDPERVDYGRIYEHRFEVLRLAYARGKEKLAEELAAFRQENAAWLEDYALFMAVKRSFGMVSWVEWPDEAIRLHKPEAVDQYRRELADDVDFWCFLQFLFFRQWKALRAYAHDKGIEFIGDVPIYVALDSADVWSAPRFFQLDENNLPTEVAGCPPDAFTEDGQLWGNPLYDWDKMKADGFGWWIRRIEGAEKLFDVIRIDHFRGFESYWAVPYGDKTARRGRWRPGPGMDLVGVLKLPTDLLRIIEARLSSWSQFPVPESDRSQVYLMQQDTYARGSWDRPVNILTYRGKDKTLEMYCAKTSADTLNFVFIRKPALNSYDAEHLSATVNVPAPLEASLIYQVAGLSMVAFREDIAATCFAIAARYMDPEQAKGGNSE